MDTETKLSVVLLIKSSGEGVRVGRDHGGTDSVDAGVRNIDTQEVLGHVH